MDQTVQQWLAEIAPSTSRLLDLSVDVDTETRCNAHGGTRTDQPGSYFPPVHANHVNQREQRSIRNGHEFPVQSRDQATPQDPAQRSHHSRHRQSTGQDLESFEEHSHTPDPSSKYAKKPRAKAKSDKYEYNGEVGVKKHVHKRKRMRTGSLGKEDFHAANINAERVTLKPNNNQFVFSRSKMSQPLAGHDLPDLTFTKMDFLSRPSRSFYRDLPKVPTKQNKKGGVVYVQRETYILPDPDVEGRQSPKPWVRSDVYLARQTVDKQQNTTTQVSQSCVGADEEIRTGTSKSHWVTNNVNPAVQEYRPGLASTQCATPMSWSTSPPRRHELNLAAVPSCYSHQVRPGKGKCLRQGQKHVSGPHSSSSDHSSSALTQHLLKRNQTFQTALDSRNIPAGYQSLQSLKDLAAKNFRHGPPDHRPATETIQYGDGAFTESDRRPFHEQRWSVGPSLVPEPSRCIYDDTAAPLLRRHQYSDPPYRQDGRPYSTCEYGEHHPDRELATLHYIALKQPDGSLSIRTPQLAIEKMYTAITPRQLSRYKQHTENVVLTKQADKGGLRFKESTASHVSDMLDRDTSCSSQDGRPQDNFDLDILHSASTGIPLQTYSAMSRPRSFDETYEAGTRGLDQTTGLKIGRPQHTSHAAELHVANTLLESHDSITSRGNESGLRLDRPTLRSRASQQGFNPFARSYMLV